MKHLVIVVLYNKEIDESSTLQTLMDSGLKKIDLVVVNNGPKKLHRSGLFEKELSSLGYLKEIVEFIGNEPLSTLYNNIIKNNYGYDYYTIMDDDSEIKFQGVGEFLNREVDIILPSIIEKQDNIKYYPIINNVVSGKEKITSDGDVYSISSGLTISNRIVQVFELENISLFDERFALYGVDTSFFKRLNKLRRVNIINIYNTGVVYHSLSRVSGANNDFRVKERLYDELLTNKYYNIGFFRRAVGYVKVCFKCLRAGKLGWCWDMFNVTLTGKHPRSKV